MKRNPNYIKTTINTRTTLVPFASEITDYRGSVTLNATAEYLWDLLENEVTAEYVYDAFIREFGAGSQDDLKAALEHWAAIGLLLRTPREITADLTGETFRIAGTDIMIGRSSDLISKTLQPYRAPSLAPDLKIALIPGFPAAYDSGRTLIANSTALITEADDGYRMLYYDLRYVRDCFLSKDGSSGLIYYQPGDRDKLREEIMQVIRVFFSLTALNRGFLFLHSASILYRDRLWLFSAHSGGGKSSHVRLWTERKAAEAINGDLNLINASDLRVYGTPWCGTSGITSTDSHALGGICMIKKAAANSTDPADAEQAALRIMNRTVSPTWDRETASKCLEFSRRIASKIPLWQLNCDLSEEAFLISKAKIDGLLS